MMPLPFYFGARIIRGQNYRVTILPGLFFPFDFFRRLFSSVLALISLCQSKARFETRRKNDVDLLGNEINIEEA